MNNLSVENLDTKLEQNIKIFIPNNGVHDYSDAERYGKITYVTKGEVNRFSVGWIARRWANALLNSSKSDCILVSSLTILTVIGTAIFARKHGRLNLLLFFNGRYVKREIMIDQLFERSEVNEPSTED